MEREELAILAGVEDGHAVGEGNFGGGLGVGSAFELNGAEDGFAGDVKLEFGVLDGVVERRAVWLFYRLGGESDEAIVFVEREGDVAG